MKRILVTGALGQLGSELVLYLRRLYGTEQVLATDIRRDEQSKTVHSGRFEQLDVMECKAMLKLAQAHRADTIVHLAALLSATAEQKPELAWRLNMGGLLNALEASRELGCALFVPSSIGAFGPGSPKQRTPQDTVQRPNTIYGVSKVAGELLCDYYHYKFGLDTRGLRFPGLISYETPPGGGTTDYAVEMYGAALKQGTYTSYISAGTYLDMMYMPDALEAIVTLMEADGNRLRHRNAFNVSAMSADPEMFADAIRRRIPEFMLDYRIDPIRQSIADSWPDALDSSAAREEWGFAPRYDLVRMTEEMLVKLDERRSTDRTITLS